MSHWYPPRGVGPYKLQDGPAFPGTWQAPRDCHHRHIWHMLRNIFIYCEFQMGKFHLICCDLWVKWICSTIIFNNIWIFSHYPIQHGKYQSLITVLKDVNVLFSIPINRRLIRNETFLCVKGVDTMALMESVFPVLDPEMII